MIEGGKGGANTLTGLKFEQRADLKQLFTKIIGCTVENEKLFFKGKLVAYIYKKHELYKNFLSKFGVKWKTILSKKLLPDQALFVIGTDTLFVIEIKFQQIAGSVDEKLQTCDFKKKQYERLLEQTNLNVEYCYLLNDWFKDPSYKDTLTYIASVECHYYFGEIPLNCLGLPKPD